MRFQRYSKEELIEQVIKTEEEGDKVSVQLSRLRDSVGNLFKILKINLILLEHICKTSADPIMIEKGLEDISQIQEAVKEVLERWN